MEKRLAELIKESLQGIEGKVAIAFSGGIDSFLLAWLLKDKEPVLYTVGTEGCYDFSVAQKAAERIGLKINKIVIDKNDVLNATKDLVEILDNMDYPPSSEDCILPPNYANAISISFNMPLYFVVKNCKEKTVVSGQGPDTMFAGYKLHEKLSKEDLKKELYNNTRDLVIVGALQHKEIGKRFGKNVVVPYIGEKIRKFALELPVEFTIKDGHRKWIFRQAARFLGLQEELVWTPKKSAQYGSGIMKLMKKIAKENGMSVGEWIEKIREDIKIH